MDPIKEYLKLETRRQFFSKCASGLGAAALATLMPNGVVNALESQAKPRFGGYQNYHILHRRRNGQSTSLCLRAFATGSV